MAEELLGQRRGTSGKFGDLCEVLGKTVDTDTQDIFDDNKGQKSVISRRCLH